MIRYILPVLALLALAGCETKEEKRQAFVDHCVAASFAPDQCRFLLSMAEKAEDDADSNAAVAGVAVGLSIGRR